MHMSLEWLATNKAFDIYCKMFIAEVGTENELLSFGDLRISKIFFIIPISWEIITLKFLCAVQVSYVLYNTYLSNFGTKKR